jgi:hypothetical protein
VQGRIRRNGGGRDDTPFIVIRDGPSLIELDWRRSSPGLSDGSFDLWIDGVLAAELEGLANDEQGLSRARLGVMSPKGGIGGTLYFDEFESWRPTAESQAIIAPSRRSSGASTSAIRMPE